MKSRSDVYLRRFRVVRNFIAIGLLMCATYSSAEINITETYDYYHIYPESVTDLKKEQIKRSPIYINGHKYFGQTKWDLKWRYKWKKNGDLCVIRKVMIDLSFIYRLPKIAENSNADKNTLTVFSSFYQKLLSHEKGHSEISMKGAEEIERVLLELNMRESCEQLKRTARIRAESMITEIKKKNKVYDLVTDHGKTQGADIDHFIRE